MQRLLLRLHSRGQCLLIQISRRQLHLFDCTLQIGDSIAITVIRKIESLRQAVDRHAGPLHGIALGICNHRHIVSELTLIHGQLLLTKAPGRSNNVFLQCHQRAAVIATASATTALLATAGTTELLIGRHHLKKIDIGNDFLGAAQIIVVCNCQVVTDKVTRLNHKVFHINHLIAGYTAGLFGRQKIHCDLV